MTMLQDSADYDRSSTVSSTSVLSNIDWERVDELLDT